MIYYIPENINLDALLSQMPIGKRWKENHLILILHFISEIPVMNKTAYSNGFTHLNSRVLQKYVRNYNCFLEMLMKEGVLESDNIYIPNEKARGFRFTKKYRTKLVQVKIDGLKVDEKFRAKKFNTKAHPHLTKWFNSNLRINKELAETELFFNHIENGHVNGLPISSIDLQIAKFSNQDFYCFKDLVGNRLHTSLLLKKEFRQFITYDNKKLVSIDICNSQPVMSLILFNESFYGDGEELNLKKIFPELYTSLNQNNTTTTTPLSLMVGVLEDLNNQKDVKLYKELVLNGLLYEYMGTQLKIDERGLAKEIMFSVLYSSNSFFNQKDALPKRIFCDLFPNVYRWLSMFKADKKNGLALLLQRLEAEVILKRITYLISIEKPWLPTYTIHDQIVVPIGNEDYVDFVLKEECAKVIGFPPSTKIEPWTMQHKLLESEFLSDPDLQQWFSNKEL